MNSDNQLILNYAANLTIHEHLIRCKRRLKSLKLPKMIKIDWKLRATFVHSLLKHLHLWISKILLNFEVTARQMHRQSFANHLVVS